MLFVLCFETFLTETLKCEDVSALIANLFINYNLYIEWWLMMNNILMPTQSISELFIWDEVPHSTGLLIYCDYL